LVLCSCRQVCVVVMHGGCELVCAAAVLDKLGMQARLCWLLCTAALYWCVVLAQ
jgi:hypothetical protein